MLRPTAFLMSLALVGLLLGCTRHKKAPATRVSSSARGAQSASIGSEAPTSLAVGSSATNPTLIPGAIAATNPGSELRFLVIGGGPVPESNEVSLEQDVNLVRRALPGPGLVLFAGGKDSPTVRELSPGRVGDPVRLALGDLFAPRSGRQSRYRAPVFEALPSTSENVERALQTALAGSKTPLFLYIAAHGDKGDAPRNNAVALWGGGSLSAARLAEIHDAHPRPLRVVATSCFSGGFGELAFARAESRGNHAAVASRCGIFAGTADRETSGCDPDPRRRAQESYGLHLTHALSGQRKDGSKLPLAAVDFDRDGKLGLLDVHTWAKIEAVSFDLPTTTSERWLRAVEPGSAPPVAGLLPEDEAVVEKLGKALGLTTAAAAEARWHELDAQIEAKNRELDAVDADLAKIEDTLATRVLERWPVLDDAYHPEFEASFAASREAVAEVLLRSPGGAARQTALERTQRLYQELDHLTVAEARVLRLLRADETLRKAAALHRRSGTAARQYERLLACERTAVE